MAKLSAELKRTVFETSRALEFFSEKELQMQLGHGRHMWPVALLKELLDNSLDACEAAGVPPEIEIAVDDDGFSVGDNGPGLPQATLEGSLNYLVRVSDKNYYISPTRGQMGNALKVIWAAPFVANDEGRVEVRSLGLHHVVDVSLDHLAQQPAISHSVEEDGLVKNGTFIRVHWPQSASLLFQPADSDFPSARTLIENYAAFNPHASFVFEGTTYRATAPSWRKWQPGNPTDPHWYARETLRDLMAAYIRKERDNEQKRRTVRAFVSEFRGLSSTAKQKQITDGLAGVYLDELVHDGDLHMPKVEQLLGGMQAATRPAQPEKLGMIGKDHLQSWMVRYAGVAEGSVIYKKELGTDGNMPFVIEVAFGVRQDDEDGLRLVMGLNWSPVLSIPIPQLSRILGHQRIDEHDPVTLVVHLARPRFEFVDRGKTRLQL